MAIRISYKYSSNQALYKHYITKVLYYKGKQSAYHGREDDGWNSTQECLPGPTNKANDSEDNRKSQKMITNRTNGGNYSRSWLRIDHHNIVA